ncbi:hypothetical protein [Streptomyces violens]|uniref:hypothetical protein n=1 Tax=Streptomyces violens TaxID=66377 RepID=UPI000AC513DF|nr:hypothetical protein [Streptomyces violens]
MPTSIIEEVRDLLGVAASALQCPSCGSPHVAQMLGDNGGVSFVCTACGHSWS